MSKRSFDTLQLTALGVFVVQHYSAAKDASSVLGVIIPAISTIAGTAFGVSQGAKAGAAAGSATAQAATSETQTVRARSEQALNGVTELRSHLDPVIEAAGTTNTALPPGQLEQTKTRLDTVEQALRAAVGPAVTPSA